jgi:hypothetical protein
MQVAVVRDASLVFSFYIGMHEPCELCISLIQNEKMNTITANG